MVGNAQVLLLLADGFLVDFKLLQLFLELQVLVASDVGSVVKNLFGKTDFLGNLESEGRTRLASHHDVHRLHEPRVEQHGTVDNALMVVGQKFEIGIVCGDHAKSLLFVEFQKDGFGDGTTKLWLSASAELINEE